MRIPRRRHGGARTGRWSVLKILQRYVLWEVITPFLLALGTLTFVLIIQMVYTHADDMAGGLSMGLVLRFAGYVLPSMLSLTIPMALLTGALLGVGRMAVDSEIKSMRTHGVQLFEIFIPVLVFGAIVMVVELFNNLYLAPHMLSESMDLVDRVRFRMVEALEANKFEDRFGTQGADVVIYFDRRDPETGALREVYLTLQGGPEGLEGDMRTKAAPVGLDKLEDLEERSRSSALVNPGQAQAGQSDPAAAATSLSQSSFPMAISGLTFPIASVPRLELSKTPGFPHDGRYSLEAWFRIREGAKGPLSILGLWHEGNQAPSLWLGIDAAGRLAMHHQDGRSSVTLASQAPVSEGAWHYGAAMRAGETDWQLFLDTVSVAHAHEPQSLRPFDSMLVGAAPPGSQSPDWQGEIGEVRVRLGKIDESALRENWNAGQGMAFPSDDERTLALWRPHGQGEGQDKESKKPALVKTLFLADSGYVETDEEASEAMLHLTSGTIHFNRGLGDTRYTLVEFAQMTQRFELDSDEKASGDEERKREVLTAGEIRQEVSQRGLDSKRGRELFAELLQRISLALGCFTFVLIGVPLAIYVRPSGKSVGIVIALILMAVYYGFLHYGIHLAREQIVIGTLAIFLPNLLLTVIGGLLLYRTCFR